MRSALFALLLSGASLGSMSVALAQDVPQGGTLVFAHEQEPSTYNAFHPTGTGGGSSAGAGLMHAGTYKFGPTGEPTPFLIAKEAEVTNDPFTVTYTIRDDAKWNDGVDITAEDYAFTYETLVNPDWTIANRTPYNLITGYEIVSPKVIKFTFSAPVPTYKQMFYLILPKHDLEGKNWDEAWLEGVPVSAGPFKFESWEKGQQVTFVKNPYFFAGGPNLDRIVLRVVRDSNTLLQLLRSGEIDASDPQPQPELAAALEGSPNLKLQSQSGLQMEWVRFNLKKPGLDKLFVRQAILMGIDRDAIVEELVKAIDPNAVAPQSFVYAPGTPNFEPKYEQYAYNPEGAIKLLEDNGCVRNADGIFECDGVKLSFGYVTTADNQRRELGFEIIQAYLQQIGIELVADFSESSVQFGQREPQGDYDLFNRGLLFDDSVAMTPFFSCKGTLNPAGFCNAELDELLKAATVAATPEDRIKLMNDVDRTLAEDLPVFPLFVLPRLVVYNDDKVGGFNVSAFADGRISQGGWYWNWNAHEFYVKAE